MISALRISKELSLPLDAVTKTFALLAVRGAGKSNAAAAMAEEMFHAGLPFVAIDPVGSWWGLRSGRDGNQRGGLPIVIFGGEHGDVPLERGAGGYIAELVAEKRMPCVIDVSEFPTENDKKRFLLDFAQKLYLKNRDPLHLFLEEADDYIPQKPMGDEAQLLRAWENIVRRGRSRGLGMTLVTQRSAAVNKMVLTQVETLFVLRTTGPQDIKAIHEWVKYHQVDESLLSSLSSLADGDAWVWSPSFLKRTERIHFRQRETFDSGATPTNLRGDHLRRPATLADVDLESIRSAVAQTIERAKADDPKELRSTIGELRAQLAKQKPVVERVEVHVVGEEMITKLTMRAEQLQHAAEEARRAGDEILEAVRMACAKERNVFHPGGRVEAVPQRSIVKPNGHANGATGHGHATAVGELVIPKETSKAAARLMALIVQAGDEGISRLALTILSGFARSTRDRYLSECSGKKWVRYQGTTVYATDEGKREFKSVPKRPTGKALREMWINDLGPAQGGIIRYLHDAGDFIERAEIDDSLVLARSTRDRYLSDLVTIGIVEKSGTRVRLSPMLFD